MRFLFLSVVMMVCIISCGDDSDTEEIRRKVQELGEGTVNADLNYFKNNHHEALLYLVDELRAIPSGLISTDSGKNEMHIIWCLRSLRYLTGIKQYGECDELETLVDEDSFYWLKLNEAGVPFFSTKMSTDTVYVAPSVVQKSIILEWKKKIYERTYELRSDVQLSVWYF